MSLNPFHRGAHRQTPRELREANDRLTAELAARTRELAAAEAQAAEAERAAIWFHDLWQKVGHQAREAGIVVECLEGQLAAAEAKVAALEAIAGPYREAAGEDAPIYTEITLTIPLPAPEPVADPDPDATVQMDVRPVRTLADALAGGS
jgi:hypothetical protein